MAFFEPAFVKVTPTTDFALSYSDAQKPDWDSDLRNLLDRFGFAVVLDVLTPAECAASVRALQTACSAILKTTDPPLSAKDVPGSSGCGLIKTYGVAVHPETRKLRLNAAVKRVFHLLYFGPAASERQLTLSADACVYTERGAKHYPKDQGHSFGRRPRKDDPKLVCLLLLRLSTLD